MKYPALRKLALLALCCLILSPCALTRTHLALAQQRIDSASIKQPPTSTKEAAVRQEAFEIVWQTIKEQFYDPTFGGVDWDKVRARYEPRVAQTASNEELHALLQEMLNELHQSHFLIIPPDAIPKFPATDGAEENPAEDKSAEENFNGGNYKLTEQLTTGIGIDLRVLDGSAVVTRVEPGSSAARAGLRPGYIIKRADGMSLDLVIEETLRHPMWQSIVRPEMHLVLLAGYINGESKSDVQLLYLDGRNRTHRISVRREKLKGEMSPPIGNLPSMFTEFETKRLAGGVGYIRFNAFVPPVMEKLCGALRTMRDAPGLIIDLRGNQGGLIGMIGGLAGLVDPRQISLGTMQMRAGRSDFYTFPQTSPYTGAVVILVDGSTQSAAEIFASGMQENNRAIVVGEQSAGNTLPSVIKELPTGALFQYGFANYRTPRGTTLEGRGVMPDVSVKLNRRALLSGHDPQLAAALQQIKLRIVSNILASISEEQADAPQVIPQKRAASGSNSNSPVIRIEEPPKPEPPPPMLLRNDKAEVKGESNLPGVEQIFEKYVAARGGRDALEKLTSRVTKGKAEISSMNLSGTTELFEKAPNKAVTNINMPGLGLMQRGFDGTKGWWQDSMRGYIRFSGYGLADMRRDANFYKDLKLKELYGKLAVTGKEKIGEREAYVVQEMSGTFGAEKLFFDVETGLLLRRNNIYYEDYREVDGVKLPFIIREETSNGFNFTFRVTEVKHNVAIDDAVFTESPSCFTRAGN
jgi:carboxyl-terminal processing protease